MAGQCTGTINVTIPSSTIDYKVGMCINFLNGIRKVVNVTPTIIYYTNWYSGIQQWGAGTEGSFGRDYIPSTPTTVITCPV